MTLRPFVSARRGRPSTGPVTAGIVCVLLFAIAFLAHQAGRGPVGWLWLSLLPLGMATAPFRDWFSGPADRAVWLGRLRTGGPDSYRTVYLTTPPSVSGRMLLALRDAAVRLVAVEKPWFGPRGLADAWRTVPLLAGSPVAFRCITHYLERPSVRFLLTQGLDFFLGGPVQKVTGRLLEPVGPVSPAMAEAGATFDLLVHLVSVARGLLPGCPIAVLEAQLGRHRDWPTATESYVRFLGEVATPAGPVSLDLEAGKFRPALDKGLRIEGPGGRCLVVDLANDTIDLVHAGTARRVFPYRGADTEPAYDHILRRLAAADPTVGLDLDGAVAVLEVLDAVRRTAGGLTPTEVSRPAEALRDTVLDIAFPTEGDSHAASC